MSHDFLLTPLHTPPAYAAVVDRVRRAVALGLLLPGDRLPPERVLAESLGVSRMTVREALRILQGEGFLITRRGSGGTTVSPTATGVSPHAEDGEGGFHEAFELRLAVETMAARLATERGDAAEVARLDACQRALAESTDPNGFRRADSEFHLTVARMSGNTMLRLAVEDARAAAFSILDRHSFTVLHEPSIRGHAAVIRAIKNNAPDDAAAAMAAHIEEAHKEVTSSLEERQPS